MLELASVHFQSLSFKAHANSLRKGKKLSSLIQNSLASVFSQHKLVGQHKLHAAYVKQIAYCIIESYRAVVTARKNQSRIENKSRFEQVSLLVLEESI